MKRLLIVTDAWYPQINGVVRSLDQTARHLRTMGLHVSFITPNDFKTLPMPGYKDISLSLASRRSVQAKILEQAPDLLHIATEGPLGWAARKIALKNKWQFTTSLHTKFPEYISKRTGIPVSWGYAALRKFHSKAHAILVTTPSMQDELAERGITNTEVWARGVDMQQFTPEGPIHPELENANWPRPFFLSVGRVATEKNLGAFLDLDLPGTKIVVGSGPDLEKLKRRYPEAKFLGAHGGQQLAALYRGADCFVFPSKTDTFGLVLVEALASGLPVAAYPVTGPIDIITESSVGSLKDDLRQACMESLAKDRAACRNHALTFSWAACTERFYASLVTLSGQHL